MLYQDLQNLKTQHRYIKPKIYIKWGEVSGFGPLHTEN